MSKRIELLRDLGSEYMQGATILVDDEKAAELVKRGKGKLSAEQTVYSHMDEMSIEQQEEATRLLAVADAAGGYREVAARSRATAEARKGAAKSPKEN